MNTVDNMPLNIPKGLKREAVGSSMIRGFLWILYTNAGFFVKISENKNVTLNFHL